MNATRNSIAIMLPAEIVSTKSVITRPKPVIDTVPTTMPAAAVASAMPIMLRAPVLEAVDEVVESGATRDKRRRFAAEERDQRFLRDAESRSGAPSRRTPTAPATGPRPAAPRPAG